MEQVQGQLKDEDKPFIPPELVDRDKLRVIYGAPLEFALKYLVDPSGIGNRPEAKHDEFDPLAAVHQQTQRRLPTGVPTGPQIPAAPAAKSGLPQPPTSN